jgi:hypothetical protein
VQPLKTIYARLGEVGISRDYLHKAVWPEWWDDHVAATAAGFAEAAGMLARYLGLELAPLLEKQTVRWAGHGHVHFKKMDGLSVQDVDMARRLSVQALRLAGASLGGGIPLIPKNAAEARDAILSEGNRTVTLESLLDYCWTLGVPVLHLSNFPPRARKMEGLACCPDGRPAIALTKNLKSPSWLVFVLAHELGHIVCGHVEADSVLIDAKVSSESDDRQEREATAFAVELLTGVANVRFTADRWLTAAELAQTAVDVGKRMKVEPGVIALNYAWNKQHLPVAQAALKLIEGECDAVETVRARACKALSAHGISDADAEFLSRQGALPSQASCDV